MYLEDMHLAMERISEYIHGYSFIQFKKDYKTVDAVIRNFEVIGEASKNLPQEFKERYPQILWTEMYLLRNKVSHDYSLVTSTLPAASRRSEKSQAHSHVISNQPAVSRCRERSQAHNNNITQSNDLMIIHDTISLRLLPLLRRGRSDVRRADGVVMTKEGRLGTKGI